MLILVLKVIVLEVLIVMAGVDADGAGEDRGGWVGVHRWVVQGTSFIYDYSGDPQEYSGTAYRKPRSSLRQTLL